MFEHKKELFESLNTKLKVYMDVNNAAIDEAQSRIKNLEDECSGYGLLHPDYYYLANDIAELIEKGRADSVKEALNLRLQQKEEAEFRAAQMKEMAHQSTIMSLQAESERFHQQKMADIEERRISEQREANRLAEEHAKAMERQAAEAEKRAREAQRKAEAADRERQRNFDRAQRYYNQALSKYNIAMMGGEANKGPAEMYKTEMEKYKAEMLKYQR